MPASSLPHGKWRWDILILCHLMAALLYVSWAFPPLSTFWRVLDDSVFFALNGLVCAGSQTMKTVYAFINTRLYDHLSGAAMAGLMVGFIFFGRRHDFFLRATIVLYMGLFMLTVFLRRVLGFLDTGRESPSRLHKDFCDLRDFAPDWRPKVDARDSFPSDHMIAAVFFTALFFAFAGKRWGIASLLMLPFFILPRLIGGAHWLTDGLVGSAIFCLIALGWTLATPFAVRSIAWLDAPVRQSGRACLTRLLPTRWRDKIPS